MSSPTLLSLPSPCAAIREVDNIVWIIATNLTARGLPVSAFLSLFAHLSLPTVWRLYPSNGRQKWQNISRDLPPTVLERPLSLSRLWGDPSSTVASSFGLWAAVLLDCWTVCLDHCLSPIKLTENVTSWKSKGIVSQWHSVFPAYLRGPLSLQCFDLKLGWSQ